jgi:hypothetical protein
MVLRAGDDGRPGEAGLAVGEEEAGQLPADRGLRHIHPLRLLHHYSEQGPGEDEGEANRETRAERVAAGAGTEMGEAPGAGTEMGEAPGAVSRGPRAGPRSRRRRREAGRRQPPDSARKITNYTYTD